MKINNIRVDTVLPLNDIRHAQIGGICGSHIGIGEGSCLGCDIL